MSGNEAYRGQRIYRFRNTEDYGHMSVDGMDGQNSVKYNYDSDLQQVDENWQVRLPIVMTKANIANAAIALAKLRQAEPRFPAFKLQFPGDGFDGNSASSPWFGMTAKGGFDKNQVGKELNIIFQKVPATNQPLYSQADFASFLVKIWAGLKAEGVEINRFRPTPVDEAPILCDDANIVCPFYYAAFKPWEDRDHGALLTTSHNPMNYADPLAGLKLKRSDLVAAGINLTVIAKTTA